MKICLTNRITGKFNLCVFCTPEFFENPFFLEMIYLMTFLCRQFTNNTSVDYIAQTMLPWSIIRIWAMSLLVQFYFNQSCRVNIPGYQLFGKIFDAFTKFCASSTVCYIFLYIASLWEVRSIYHHARFNLYLSLKYF